MSEWNEVRLGDIAGYITDKTEVLRLTLRNYISTENMLPNIGGITDSSSLPNIKNVNEFKKGDILFSNIRTYFKKLWLADFNGGSSTDVLTIRSLHEETVLTEYIYYYLTQDDFFNYTVQTSKGTKMPRGDKNAILEYRIKYPTDINIQTVIIKSCANFKNKIELNNQMNKTLEEIAQTLFKRWFVDFEFPNEAGLPYKSSGGEMVSSELGEIPKGWEVQEISQVIEVRDGTHDSPKFLDEGYPLITSKHLKINKIDIEEAKLISEDDFNAINQRSIVNQHDILISMIGTIGNMYYVEEEIVPYAIKNIGLFKSSKNKYFSRYIYQYLKTPLIINHIKMRLAGSTQQYISLSELRKIPLLTPTNSIIDIFNSSLETIYNILNKNMIETQTLTKTRDLLLPKMMSGEIRV